MADPIINIFQGDTVNFTDISIGDITEYSWQFPGGGITGATAPNPSVKYSNIGEFDVSLTTKDAYNVYNTELKSGIIKVEASPWGVNFQYNKPLPVFLGDSLILENISIGTPTYSEWTFPTDGVLASGVTFSGPNAKDDLPELRYMNWDLLTGSHSAPSGTVHNTNATLFSSSDFALGSKTKPLEITKLGPVEEYYEVYEYVAPHYTGNLFNAGGLDSTAYGQIVNESGNTNRENGLTYSFATLVGGATAGSFIEPYTLADRSVLHKINFEPSFASSYWGATGPTGLFYPHVDNEKAEIIGRAFAPFNIGFNGKYRANSADVLNAIGGVGSGSTLGDNITLGNYTSDIKVPAPGVNEIVNPEFALIKDTYKDNALDPYERGYLSLYAYPNDMSGLMTGGTVIIAKDTVDKLLEHPKALPTPGPTGYVEEPPTIGITTSADIHLSSDSRLTSQWARTYLDTRAVIQSKILAGPSTFVGKYPAIPSQYVLPHEISVGPLSPVGPLNTITSSIPPLGVDIIVEYYSGEIIPVHVYFGLPDGQSRVDGPINVPISIDPIGPQAGVHGPTGYAQAYGNDQPNGCWILAEDTQFGLGAASYINAYINDYADTGRGLPGGTSEIIAKVDDYWTLPTPYSENHPGTIISGGTGGVVHRAGISIEVKNPQIRKVSIKESYGAFRIGQASGQPMYQKGLLSAELIETPMTWNFGLYYASEIPDFPYYIGPEQWVQRGSSYLGISSLIMPFTSGPLNDISDGGIRQTGIKIGGSL